MIFSQSLLALTDKVITRDAARLVQRPAMRVWQEGGDFAQLVKEDGEIGRHLTKDEIAAVFDLNRYFRHVDAIFVRVFGSGR
ncbi:MAG: hypothetical protein ACOZFS_07500 [Thermodesulfobacteriota bacterium]